MVIKWSNHTKGENNGSNGLEITQRMKRITNSCQENVYILYIHQLMYKTLYEISCIKWTQGSSLHLVHHVIACILIKLGRAGIYHQHINEYHIYSVTCTYWLVSLSRKHVCFTVIGGKQWRKTRGVLWWTPDNIFTTPEICPFWYSSIPATIQLPEVSLMVILL